MKRCMGEYNESLKKLFGSFRKRFDLEYSETLDYVDNIIADRDYSILFFTSDSTYSKELIDDINASGLGAAFGFYRNDSTSISFEEIKEAVPRIVGDGGNKFILVELCDKSRLRLEDIKKTIFIKLGRNHGELYLDVVKSREYIDDEVIRKMEKQDKKEFNELYNTLYMKRWENRNDIFLKNFKMTTSELSILCNRSNSVGVFLCFKNEQLVGFILYESLEDMDNKGIEMKSYITIRDIYVVEEYRRCGIATRMFREVTRVASRGYAKKIRFKTWAMDEETVGFVNSLNQKPLYTVYEVEI